VRIEFSRTDTEISLRVNDEGDGFDFGRFLANDDFALDRPNGRGILSARSMCFDLLEYQGKGNVVVATTQLAQDKPGV